MNPLLGLGYGAIKVNMSFSDNYFSPVCCGSTDGNRTRMKDELVSPNSERGVLEERLPVVSSLLSSVGDVVSRVSGGQADSAGAL